MSRLLMQDRGTRVVMRALVTGSTGFIGSRVAAALAGAGHEVLGLARSRPESIPQVDRQLQIDLRDHRAVRAVLSGCDAVFHVAGLYSYRRSDAAAMEAVNTGGTGALLTACRDAGVRRVVLTSSAATCGPVPGRLADERDSPPAWELVVPYKRTKWEAEQLALQAAQAGLEVVVVNPATVVGPGDRRPTPTGKMVRDVVQRRMWGYLRAMGLNVVDVEDVALGHLLAYERGRAGERYILGGENLTLRELFEMISASAGVPAPRIGVPYPVAMACASVLDGLGGLVGTEAELLNPDEVRLARLPQFFSSAKAEGELGYSHRPVAEALARAAASFDTVTPPGALAGLWQRPLAWMTAAAHRRARPA
ncbi:MAG: NAD-dependent epimerase/dehydratase family protein [Solirubrobacteraceae bacterium]